MNLDAYNGRRVLVTGHTGFKGSWLCEWLLSLGAEVHGFALEPPTRPALFSQLRLARRIASHEIGDVRDRAAVLACVKRVKPHFIFHLAAQPIVRESYRTPAATFDTNVMGTVNVLEAVREWRLRTGSSAPCSVVCVTTDKVYANDNSGRAFLETDPLGGDDPYSASKGACEIVAASYRSSFFRDSSVRLATARAGNVIGGGDWARDRIVPDAMRAFLHGRPLVVRNRRSTRPWQHVLEPLCGYLMLGAALDAGVDGADSAFNFGPDAKTVRTVGVLAEALAAGCFRRGEVRFQSEAGAPREALRLQLNSSKAKNVLGWRPCFGFSRTVSAVCEWYLLVNECLEAAPEVTRRQIEDYCKIRLGKARGQ